MSETRAAAEQRERERAIFDAGFLAALRYGDNYRHYHGEQADRVFRKAMEEIDAVRDAMRASKEAT